MNPDRGSEGGVKLNNNKRKVESKYLYDALNEIQADTNTYSFTSKKKEDPTHRYIENQWDFEKRIFKHNVDGHRFNCVASINELSS